MPVHVGGRVGAVVARVDVIRPPTPLSPLLNLLLLPIPVPLVPVHTSETSNQKPLESK